MVETPRRHNKSLETQSTRRIRRRRRRTQAAEGQVRRTRTRRSNASMGLGSTLTMMLMATFGTTSVVCGDDLIAASSSNPYNGLAAERGDTITSAFINVTWEVDDTWKSTKEELGRYGSGQIGPASGLVVHVTNDKNPEDHTGCQLPFRSGSGRGELPREPWIALIKRGRCNFDDKVKNAFQSSASGVIVYNDRDSTELDRMKLITDNSRNITAIFTYKWKGEDMARLVENNSKVFAYITIAGHKPSRAANINRTSVLFVSITFIVLMIISLAWLVFYYVQRFRYIHAKDRLSKRLCNAAKKALSKIPTKNIKVGDKELQGDGECCAICIEPYRVPEILRTLPCSHEFHKSCIDPWLLEHRTCPMCKMDILKHYGFFSGSQESILHMEVEEVQALDANNDNSPRRNGGGISPLPQIRAIIVNDSQRYNGHDSDHNSSRSSSPNEMTPSLSTNRQMLPVRQDLCVSCIAAAIALEKRDAMSGGGGGGGAGDGVLTNTSSADLDDCYHRETGVSSAMVQQQQQQ